MKNEERGMKNGKAPANTVFVLRSPFSVLRSPFSVLRFSFSVLRFSFSVLRFSFFVVLCVGIQTATGEGTPPKLVGSASCATAACHGGLAGHKFVGSEFPIWDEQDPHSRAYSVLRDDLSRQMAQQLKLPKPAHESAVCLNCHSPATSADSKLSSIFVRAPLAGVDCEQCHGPAERWLTEHVRTDWKPRSAEDKRRRGYRDLADVLTRANVCADCHVGGLGRDVNHDLIAAGHPRLFFELSTFHANWPKHWGAEVDEKRHPSAECATGSIFEAKLWAVGQVVTAQRSLELLSQRAELAKREPAKWPELAEWNCFACHHDLQSASWWQSKDEARRQRVSFGWNVWPYALLEPSARQQFGPAVQLPDPALAKLRLHFATLLPPADAIAREATAAAQTQRIAAERINQADAAKDVLSLKSLAALRLSLVSDDGPRLVRRDWDSATQLFLSLNALQSAIIAARGSSTEADQERDRQLQTVLDSMNETLNFQPGLRSPRDFAAQPVERLQSDLQNLRKLLIAPQP